MSTLLICFIIKVNELQALNYSNFNAFILFHCGLYINYIIICFNTFETNFSYFIYFTYYNK